MLDDNFTRRRLDFQICMCESDTTNSKSVRYNLMSTILMAFPVNRSSLKKKPSSLMSTVLRCRGVFFTRVVPARVSRDFALIVSEVDDDRIHLHSIGEFLAVRHIVVGIKQPI